MPLSKRGLETLAKHKYQGRDDSILYHYVLNHWFVFALKFVPEWVAPNVITLSGLIIILVDFIVVWYHSPWLTGAMPSWVYALSAISLFVYQTMDNLDGKQARRTGSSSPLGELFDHGVDAVVITLQSLVACSVSGIGPGLLSLMQLLMVMFPFWLATWESYHTGILHLPIINGPEEGLFFIYSSFMLTAIAGPEIWQRGYKEVFHLQSLPLPDIPLHMATIFFLMIILIITGFSNVHRVLQHIRDNKKSPWPAIQHIITFLIFFGAWGGWYLFSTHFSISIYPTIVEPSLFHEESSVWFMYPYIVQGSLGLAFAEMVGLLILKHMLGEDFPLIPRSLWVVLAIFGYSVLKALYPSLLGNLLISETNILIVFVIVVMIGYANFVMSTIMELCGFLRISVLTIPNKKK